MIVVIDGPAGAGKSSTAKAVARQAGLDYIDSGAIYRGYTVLYNRVEQNASLFFEAIEQNRLVFEFERDESRVLLDGREITHELRSDNVNARVSEVAAMPEVRRKVTRALKEAAGNGDYIAEGRDLGTVVFPEAELKFFLTADLEERARRRMLETGSKDEADTEGMQKVRDNLHQRDTIDSSRKEAPLQSAPDAVTFDTTRLSFNRQVAIITEAVEAERNKQSEY